MITVLDYGLGNLASIVNMLKKAGGKAVISADLKEIEQADKLIIPGVGHFARGMENLQQKKFVDILNKKAREDKIPILGICLGMQLLTEHSEEGNVAGLGFIKAATHRFSFPDETKLKIPHMGWDDVTVKAHPLFAFVTEVPRYYFVHSYYVKCKDASDSIGTCRYGIDFDCAIANKNIMGVQFHPEKSHRFGMQVLKNFMTNF